MSMPSYKKILYATDLGDKMRPVFRHAVSLAEHYQANIIMLHVAEPLGDTGMAMLELYMPDKVADFDKTAMSEVLNVMEERLERFTADELGSEQSDLVSNVVVVSGHPAEQIAKYADKKSVDLIVVGTHTRDVLESTFLGSTARKLIDIAKQPVLVVPAAH